SFLLRGDRGGQKVVRLVTRRLRGGETESVHELREQGELLEQLVVELPSALVGRKRLVPVRRHLERIPADDQGPRLLGVPEAQEKVREADEGVRRPALRSSDRLRQRVVGAVGERVAVDHQQRALQSDASSSWIPPISRSVASREAGPISRSRRSSSGIGGP